MKRDVLEKVAISAKLLSRAQDKASEKANAYLEKADFKKRNANTDKNINLAMRKSTQSINFGLGSIRRKANFAKNVRDMEHKIDVKGNEIRKK